MQILIVEDTDSIRRMLQALVSARADEVVAVATGEEALDRAFAIVPDLILLDLNLPGLYSGVEVCTRLRADPKTRKVPIFIVSASVDAESQLRAKQAGASRFFPKPFSPMAILREIDELRVGAPGAARAGPGASSLARPTRPSQLSPHPQESSDAATGAGETPPPQGSDPRRRT
jgi:CheY-like chemotaxis protein